MSTLSRHLHARSHLYSGLRARSQQAAQPTATASATLQVARSTDNGDGVVVASATAQPSGRVLIDHYELAESGGAYALSESSMDMLAYFSSTGVQLHIVPELKAGQSTPRLPRSGEQSTSEVRAPFGLMLR